VLTVGRMKTALALCAVSLFVGCAADPADSGRDVATDDAVDPDAKTDAARPVGIYELIDPLDFDEGMPRMEHLDLRRDDTFYTYEIGFSCDQDGYNCSEGYSSYFGTYTLNKDRYNNRYLRVRDERNESWRYKYKVSGDELHFYYRNGDVGWKMRRLEDPTAAHLARIEAVWESGDNRRKVNDRASTHPDAIWSRFYDLRETGDYAIYTVNVDGTVHYALYGEDMVEIYAKNNQLLAAALHGETWEWTGDLF